MYEDESGVKPMSFDDRRSDRNRSARHADQSGNAREGSWVTKPWIGFDTETTGVSPTRDRLVTAAVVVRRKGAAGNDRTDEEKSWLANPGVPIPAGAARIHGITTAVARKRGRRITEVLEEVNADLASHMNRGGMLVVFNAGFDLPLLQAESARHRVEELSSRLGGPVAPVVDPLVLDRALVKYRRGKRTLADLTAAYGVPLPKNTHTADVDATLTLNLLAAMVKEHAQLRAMTSAQLHQFQTESHAKWAEDFERYLRSINRPANINRHWF